MSPNPPRRPQAGTALLLSAGLLAFAFPAARAQDSSSDSANRPPQGVAAPDNVTPNPPPPPAYQPPPAPPPPAGHALPPRRRPDPKLDEAERELLQKHQENASKYAKRPTAKEEARRGKTTALVSGSAPVDFVDEPIKDVIRAIAYSYKLNIIPDNDIGDPKVTIHLENSPIIETLQKLCAANGLELAQDGSVYRVRKADQNVTSHIRMHGRLVDIDVQNLPVKQFLKEFVDSTRINVAGDAALQGNISSHLRDLPPLDALKAIMEANNFPVRQKNGVWLVEAGDANPSDPGSYRRGRRPGFSSGGGNGLEVDVQGGKVNLSLNNANLSDAVREILNQAGVNNVINGDLTGTVTADLKGVSVDEALAAVLQGSRYGYIRKKETIIIGERNPNSPTGQYMAGTEIYYLKHLKVDGIEKLYPKSQAFEGIRPLKEQNAVLISGTSDDINLVKSFLKEVDLPVYQVLMEVIVVEYVRDGQSVFGIAPGDSKTGPDPSGPGPSLDAHAWLDGLRSTFRNGNFTGGITVLPQDFNLSLRALERKDRAKVLSMPKITTLNGNKAELRVTRTIYKQVQSVTKDGFQNIDYRTIDDGITIELTPWVTQYGEVNVNIVPSIKTAGASTGSEPPPVTNRSVSTNVKLRDGQTIALGGLISSQEGNSRRFVPILGSIPILGYLFSYRNQERTTTELVIYITPHLISDDYGGVDLGDELHSLDQRGGFIRNADFLNDHKRFFGKDEDADSAAGDKEAPKPKAQPSPAAAKSEAKSAPPAAPAKAVAPAPAPRPSLFGHRAKADSAKGK